MREVITIGRHTGPVLDQLRGLLFGPPEVRLLPGWWLRSDAKEILQELRAYTLLRPGAKR